MPLIDFSGKTHDECLAAIVVSSNPQTTHELLRTDDKVHDDFRIKLDSKIQVYPGAAKLLNDFVNAHGIPDDTQRATAYIKTIEDLKTLPASEGRDAVLMITQAIAEDEFKVVNNNVPFVPVQVAPAAPVPPVKQNKIVPAKKPLRLPVAEAFAAAAVALCWKGVKKLARAVSPVYLSPFAPIVVGGLAAAAVGMTGIVSPNSPIQTQIFEYTTTFLVGTGASFFGRRAMARSPRDNDGNPVLNEKTKKPIQISPASRLANALAAAVVVMLPAGILGGFGAYRVTDGNAGFSRSDKWATGVPNFISPTISRALGVPAYVPAGSIPATVLPRLPRAGAPGGPAVRPFGPQTFIMPPPAVR